MWVWFKPIIDSSCFKTNQDENRQVKDYSVSKETVTGVKFLKIFIGYIWKCTFKRKSSKEFSKKFIMLWLEDQNVISLSTASLINFNTAAMLQHAYLVDVSNLYYREFKSMLGYIWNEHKLQAWLIFPYNVVK